MQLADMLPSKTIPEVNRKRQGHTLKPRVFSGGRDTISLRRASLHADTIRILMLVKSRLHVVRAKST